MSRRGLRVPREFDSGRRNRRRGRDGIIAGSRRLKYHRKIGAMRVDVLHLSNSKSLDAPAITCVAKVADSNPDRGCLGMPLNGGTVVGLQNPTQATKLSPATPLKRGPKGPVPKRRHQEGTLGKENGRYYSFFYRDRVMPDGNVRSVKERFDRGKVGEVSELSARPEHDPLRQNINRERGSVPTAPKGETFKDAADAYIESVARTYPARP